MDFHKYLKTLKGSIYLETILGIATAVYVMNAAIFFPTHIPIFVAAILVFGGLTYYAVRRTYAKATDYHEGISPDSSVWEKNFDKYSKRMVNWIMIAFLEVFELILTMVSLGVNSKTSEMMATLNGQIILLEVLSFFLIKNMLLVRWLCRIHQYENDQILRKITKRVVIISAIYWLIALAIFCVFEIVFVLNIAPFVSAMYVLGIILFNLRGINEFTYQKKNRFKIVAAVLLAVCILVGGYSFLSRDIWMTQPYINSVPNIYDGKSEITYDDATGIYTITKRSGDFKILQLTDIHIGGSVLSYDKDLKALKACYELINRTRPDFVIVTGDLTFPVGYASFSFNNTAPAQQFAAFMRNLGVPWAFTYGNHDTESYAATSGYDLDALYRSLSYKTSKTLLYPYTQPQIKGRSNQLIELRNADGSLNQGLFLIDSNAYTGDGFNKYDFIHDDQVDWYADEVKRMQAEAGHNVPSLVFFHIPLQEYREAYQLYEAGSDEVTYYFGENNEDEVGTVCCSDHPSKLFETARELGSTTGFFCGHDHYNNMSLEYQGMRLTYGMSIDYLAMPGIARDIVQRGGTLITVHDDGSTDIRQVPLGK